MSGCIPLVERMRWSRWLRRGIVIARSSRAPYPVLYYPLALDACARHYDASRYAARSEQFSMGTEPDEVKFDLELTRRNFDHDEALMREIGGIFIEDVPQLVEQLNCLRDRLLNSQADEQSVQQRTLALREAKRLVHSIKGLAATFGAEPLVSLAQQIEEGLVGMPEERMVAKIHRLTDVALETVDQLAIELRLTQDDRNASPDPRPR